MKRFFAFVGVFMVLGCSGKPASVSLAEGAKETISGVYATLPKECQTEGVRTFVKVAHTQIDSIVFACDSEKEILEQKQKNLKIIIGVLVLALGAILWKKF